MWGGRFEDGPDALFREINDSLPVDWRLVREDITGSIAWAWALGEAGVITSDESARLQEALRALRSEAQSIAAPPVESGAEDVHTWVEQQLIGKLGDLGKKLHTGRSRNDQVATDLRLWTRAAIRTRITEIRTAQSELVSLGEREVATPLPGYTHLQRAQPVLLAHWCLAHVESLERDVGRFEDAASRASECPLGSGALAGAAYPVDRAAIAEKLGFKRETRNSLDAVSARDFVAEAIFACSMCAAHLSRLAEEMIVYASSEFGLLAFDDAVTSGSSLMPQKKNPDALELVRGKAGRIFGELIGVLTMLKGLPLAYNKDLQEDKHAIFTAMDQLSLVLRITELVTRCCRVDREACTRAASGGHANATELADHLVERGVPFRDAHERTGRLVRLAMERGVALEELPIETIHEIAPQATEAVYERLALSSLLDKRDVVGGTAPARVALALAEARARIGEQVDAGVGTA
jgi:argininosuccinate lyase